MFNRNLKLVTCSALALSMMFAVVGCNKPAATQSGSASTAASTAAKTWKPEKGVTITVPYAAGGSSDLLARAVEKVWSKYETQPLTILNKTAGGGAEGSVYVARSKPDGLNLVLAYGSGVDLVMPHIQKIEYDPFKDLDPLVRLSVHSVLVAVPANSPFKSIKDVIDWGKKENKPVTAAVSTTAGAVDIVMRGIGKFGGIQVTPVPHSGGSQATATLVGGQTAIGGGHPAEIQAQVKANRILPIGIATPDRDPVLKDVPTLKEQGLNFSTNGSIKGLAVPKNTPPEIKKYYEDIFKKITDDADFKKTMSDMWQPVQYQNIADFTKYFKDSFDEYGKLVKELGLEQKK